MTQVAEVMTRGARAVSPADSLRIAAQAMEEMDVGSMPVCDGGRLVGILTDRDIAIRAVAHGKSVDSPVSEVMSDRLDCCYEDQPLEEAAELMEVSQIRRLPVLDREKKLVGMLALGDIAAKADGGHAADALSEISTPARPARPR